MKCICNMRCFLPNSEGRNTRYNPGDIDAFEECPPHFVEVDKADEVDFLTAGFEELQERDWSFDEADAAMDLVYKMRLVRGSKVEVVNQILDIRDRNDLQPVIPPAAE